MDSNGHKDSFNTIMTLTETAEYLKLAEKTVLRMIHRNEIPCAKVGNQWRFMRAMLDDWLVSKMQVVPRNDLAKLIETGDESVPLSRLIRPEYVILDLRPGNKESVLGQLITPLVERGIVTNYDKYLGGLMNREQMVSTAIGYGIALPHIRNPMDNPASEPVIVVGICPLGTDFGAPDAQKTHLFFLLSTDSEVVHLRTLSRLTGMLRESNVIKKLINCTEQKQVVSVLMRAERDFQFKRLKGEE